MKTLKHNVRNTLKLP